MQDLPLELLNEPVTYNDNLYRVEMTIPRPMFLFIVTERDVSVTMGGKLLCSVYHEDEAPSKFSSTVSILTIYDTYGLSIAARYLNHISSGWFSQLCWYKVYLVGCMAALDLEVVKYKHANEATMIASIYSELIRRDNGRYVIPLASSSTLPAEIVALITNSLRLSKDIRALVRQYRTSCMPRRENLLGYHSYSTRLRSGVYWCMSAEHSIVLTRLGNEFYLSTDASNLLFDSRTPIHVTRISLHNVYEYYKSLNCNPQDGLKFVLTQMSRRAWVTSLSHVCASVVQLLHDLRSTESVEPMTENELRAYLLVLITKCETHNFDLKGLSH